LEEITTPKVTHEQGTVRLPSSLIPRPESPSLSRSQFQIPSPIPLRFRPLLNARLPRARSPSLRALPCRPIPLAFPLAFLCRCRCNRAPPVPAFTASRLRFDGLRRDSRCPYHDLSPPFDARSTYRPETVAPCQPFPSSYQPTPLQFPFPKAPTRAHPDLFEKKRGAGYSRAHRAPQRLQPHGRPWDSPEFLESAMQKFPSIDPPEKAGHPVPGPAVGLCRTIRSIAKPTGGMAPTARLRQSGRR
jgi:hypothetical protein